MNHRIVDTVDTVDAWTRSRATPPRTMKPQVKHTNCLSAGRTEFRVVRRVSTVSTCPRVHAAW